MFLNKHYGNHKIVHTSCSRSSRIVGKLYSWCDDVYIIHAFGCIKMKAKGKGSTEAYCSFEMDVGRGQWVDEKEYPIRHRVSVTSIHNSLYIITKTNYFPNRYFILYRQSSKASYLPVLHAPIYFINMYIYRHKYIDTW